MRMLRIFVNQTHEAREYRHMLDAITRIYIHQADVNYDVECGGAVATPRNRSALVVVRKPKYLFYRFSILANAHRQCEAPDTHS